MGIMHALADKLAGNAAGNTKANADADAPAMPSPETPAPADALTSNMRAERHAAMKAMSAAINDELTATMAELKRAEAAAQTKANAKRDAMKATLEAHEDALDRALAADMHATLVPLIRAFADAPRSTAAEFARAFRAYNERAQKELGQPVAEWALIGLFAFAGGLERRALGTDGVIGLTEAGKLYRQIAANGADILVEDAMRNLEVAIAHGVMGKAEDDGRAAEVVKAHATHSHLFKAVEALRAPDPRFIPAFEPTNVKVVDRPRGGFTRW